jgi:hypothetical protein
MCLDEKCGRIDIIEIYDDIKVILHYERGGDKPFYIQYWDTSKPFSKIPAKNISLDFDLRYPPKKFIAIGEDLDNSVISELFSGFSSN